MSKKAIKTAIMTVIIVIAVAGLSVGISFAAGAWRVDEVKTGVGGVMGDWNAAVKDMVFEPVINAESGETEAYKLVAYKGTMNALSIPETYDGLPVTTIGSKFARLNGIVVLQLPHSITTIENNALMGFKHLKSITFSAGIETIGDNVLNGCNSLKSVWLPNTLTSLGAGALSQCGLLEFIDFEGAEGSFTKGAHSLDKNNVAGGGCTVSYGVKEGAAHE